MKKDMAPGDWIATREMLCVLPDGSELIARAAVGRPYDTGEGDWACPVELGLYGRHPDVPGVDSVQALCLALSFLRTELERFLEDGGKILDPEDRSAWSRQGIATTFGGVRSL